MTMTDQIAASLIKSNLEGYKVKKLRETPTVFLFTCDAEDKDVFPSKLVAAVSKKTSKIGLSNKSYEEAIKMAVNSK